MLYPGLKFRSINNILLKTVGFHGVAQTVTADKTVEKGEILFLV